MGEAVVFQGDRTADYGRQRRQQWLSATTMEAGAKENGG